MGSSTGACGAATGAEATVGVGSTAVLALAVAATDTGGVAVSPAYASEHRVNAPDRQIVSSRSVFIVGLLGISSICAIAITRSLRIFLAVVFAPAELQFHFLSPDVENHVIACDRHRLDFHFPLSDQHLDWLVQLDELVIDQRRRIRRVIQNTPQNEA